MLLVEILLLLIVTFQDFKDRAISLWVFIALFIFKISLWIFNIAPFNGTSVLLNICYIFILASCALLYYFLKYKFDSFKQLKNSVGTADILLIIYFAISLPSLFFIVFVLFGVLFSLIIHLLIQLTVKQRLIPFAAYLSIFYISILIGDLIIEQNLVSNLIIYEWLKLL